MPQANRLVTARITFRRATTAEWQENDPVLLNGEPCIDTTLNKFKIGDGVKNWSEIPYVQNLATSPSEWENDGSGLFPAWVQGKDDAINYTKFHQDLLKQYAVSYFQAGLDGGVNRDLYDVVVKAGTGGSASIQNATRRFNAYQDGTQVQITAVPFNSYTFSGWSGLASGEANTATTTITINATREITANFTL